MREILPCPATTTQRCASLTGTRSIDAELRRSWCEDHRPWPVWQLKMYYTSHICVVEPYDIFAIRDLLQVFFAEEGEDGRTGHPASSCFRVICSLPKLKCLNAKMACIEWSSAEVSRR
jgi:hypothetical protein